ncbi:MAG: hypothetical protein FWF34_02185, partial [Alphaproteobacteria bacterium]|nr:hypothetical protein [Alphaproteobacteria bacterium]
MKPLNQTFNEFKKNLPPYVLWMLLAAAFLVVVILLFLLLSGPKKNTVTAGAAIDGALIIDPDAVEMRGITVGNMGETRITVSANTAMRITDVFLDDNIDGLSIRNSTCQNIGIISERAPCVVTIEWKPVNELKDTGTKINIKYHLASQSIEMSHIETVPVLISARRAEIIAEPVPAPEPFFDTPAAPEPTLDFTFDFDEFANIFEETAPTVVAPVAPPRPEPVRESCFDFAMPGYNLSGRHAGWIRPSAGRYLFHPFADTECKNPIGEYNPNTGLITDINNPSRTIGSDVDSIGGRGIGANLAMPILSNPVPTMPGNRARQVEGDLTNVSAAGSRGSIWGGRPRPQPSTSFRPSSLGDPRGGGMGATEATVSSVPYDRTFVLRQYKPIPATIVNEVRADAKNQSRLPVQATVDRHVYSDNGRTIIVPAGTLMLGWAHGDLPGPYKSIGRMQISWYRFVRPDGVEFNFMGDENTNPFSGDSQGRVGVPGRGSTDYLESMIMPMMTALVPAAVNLIAPISDRFVNQINLDNNTVTQSGQVRSSELAKQEIITTWNRVVQKLALDIMDNTVPPFSIAAGTRITVFSPTDLVVTCGDPADTNDTRNCAMIAAPSTDYAV